MQRFNNGNGCYTCDACDIIIWYGFDGFKNPDNRISQKNNYIVTENSAYCIPCANRILDKHSNRYD